MGKYIVTVSDTAKAQLVKHFKSGEKGLIKKIERIFEELGEYPYVGVGKPEPLKYSLSGLWSRRLDEKNRLIYEVKEQIVTVFVLSAKGHYDEK